MKDDEEESRITSSYVKALRTGVWLQLGVKINQAKAKIKGQ